MEHEAKQHQRRTSKRNPNRSLSSSKTEQSSQLLYNGQPSPRARIQRLSEAQWDCDIDRKFKGKRLKRSQPALFLIFTNDPLSLREMKRKGLIFSVRSLKFFYFIFIPLLLLPFQIAPFNLKTDPDSNADVLRHHSKPSLSLQKLINDFFIPCWSFRTLWVFFNSRQSEIIHRITLEDPKFW